MYDLSIIIPHYNTPSYLKQLLETIPALPNIQVIVVDDKSDKDVEYYLALKNDMAFENVTFLSNDTSMKNAGTCRNIGLQNATGKWLLFADADDLFVEGFYNIIEKYFSSEYDVVFFPPTSTDRDTSMPALRHLQTEKIVRGYNNFQTPENELNLRYRFYEPWSKMIRRELVCRHNIKFNEVIKSNDVAFSTKIGCYMKSFTTSPDTIYCITNSPGSLTKTISEEGYDVSLGEFIYCYNFIKMHLSEKDFKLLGLCAAENFVFKVLKYGFGFKKLISVLKLLRQNKVKIVTGRYLSKAFLKSGLKNEMKSYRRNKRFFTRV